MSYKIYRTIKQITALGLLCTATLGSADTLVPERANMTTLSLPPVSIKPQKEIPLHFSVTLPAKHEINKDAPSDIIVQKGGAVLHSGPVKEESFTIQLPANACSGDTLKIESSLYYCGVIDKVCKIKSFLIEAPCSLNDSGGDKIEVTPAISQ